MQDRSNRPRLQEEQESAGYVQGAEECREKGMVSRGNSAKAENQGVFRELPEICLAGGKAREEHRSQTMRGHENCEEPVKDFRQETDMLGLVFEQFHPESSGR